MILMILMMIFSVFLGHGCDELKRNCEEILIKVGIEGWIEGWD